jgi:subtilisin family serine protease
MKIKFLLALLFAPLFLSAQPKYWIYLKDKNQTDVAAISQITRENRKMLGLEECQYTDLPIRQDYTNKLQAQKIKIRNQSRWLNAVSAELSSEQAMKVRDLDFVQDVVPIDAGFYIASSQSVARAQLAPVMSQVEANVFAKAGYTGKGITIGVIDAGFYSADSTEALQHVFAGNNIRGIRDYVRPERAGELLFSTAESFSDTHGTEVMTAITGFDESEQVQYGMALNASFYLARTDYSLREYRGEEDNWISAMEWMDSLGVRLINTSLGYAKGFTNPSENYTPSQMDGKTSAITRAAQMASDQKGMVLIVSAGNEGDDKGWGIVSAPADAKGVMAIGATNQKLWNRIGYSSIGPEFLDYIKPNVSCFSLYGTSLSAPVITGFMACVMQANPIMSNKELIELVEKSAHLYPYGNNYVGYGVPLASRAIALSKAPYLPNQSKLVLAHKKTIQIEVDSDEMMVALYRKRNKKDVISQQIGKVQDGKITLKRQNGERFTTVDLKSHVVEVQWN